LVGFNSRKNVSKTKRIPVETRYSNLLGHFRSFFKDQTRFLNLEAMRRFLPKNKSRKSNHKRAVFNFLCIVEWRGWMLAATFSCKPASATFIIEGLSVGFAFSSYSDQWSV